MRAMSGPRSEGTGESEAAMRLYHDLASYLTALTTREPLSTKAVVVGVLALLGDVLCRVAAAEGEAGRDALREWVVASVRALPLAPGTKPGREDEQSASSSGG